MTNNMSTRCIHQCIMFLLCTVVSVNQCNEILQCSATGTPALFRRLFRRLSVCHYYIQIVLRYCKLALPACFSLLSADAPLCDRILFSAFRCVCMHYIVHCNHISAYALATHRLSFAPHCRR